MLPYSTLFYSSKLNVDEFKKKQMKLKINYFVNFYTNKYEQSYVICLKLD